MPDTYTLAWEILEICWINLLLSGDNAILIALACRGLEERQQRLGMLLGALGAVALRIAFTFAIGGLLGVPGLRIAGGLFVIFLAVKLPGQASQPPEIEAKPSLLGAVRAIIVADAVMSMDNVLALAAAAKGSMPLIVFGLLLSAPLVMFGARFLSALMERFPILVWTGAVVLGWAGGELVSGDPIWLRAGFSMAPAEQWIGAVGAAFVLGAGFLSTRAAILSR
jgi:YjbE family integral membrane protein